MSLFGHVRLASGRALPFVGAVSLLVLGFGPPHPFGGAGVTVTLCKHPCGVGSGRAYPCNIRCGVGVCCTNIVTNVSTTGGLGFVGNITPK